MDKKMREPCAAKMVVEYAVFTSSATKFTCAQRS